ncbi:MAG: YqgE/AlgH family protein [Rickettsia sp.]|nr:YqgE/AlgH family protein [Rickettsia sp.]
MNKRFEPISNFSNKFLVANTEMSQGTIFYRSVIYIIHHSFDGAFGLIINQPLSNISQNLEGILSLDNTKLELYLGGPVATNKRFFLHSNEYNKNLLFQDNFSKVGLSTNSEILKDIENGQGPENTLMMIGYSSWGSGKLEYEIENNFWLISEVDENIIFSKNFSDKWELALNKILGNKDRYIPFSTYC